jgi:hypothetical protein
MGIGVVVFEERSAPIDGDLIAWIRAQRKAELEGEWQSTETSSIVLNSWFNEMRETFPSLPDADPDNSRGTDYNFYKHFVQMDIAGSVGEEGVITAWKLADKYGLRILVGGELLPRSAPQGERRVHITVLDGGRVGTQSTGGPIVSIVILDPAYAPFLATNQWVRNQLDVEEGSDDRSSIIASDPLKQWNDEFTTLHLGCVHIGMRFFRKFTLLRTRPKDLHSVAPAAIELATKLHLGLLFFEDLDLYSYRAD